MSLHRVVAIRMIEKPTCRRQIIFVWMIASREADKADQPRILEPLSIGALGDAATLFARSSGRWWHCHHPDLGDHLGNCCGRIRCLERFAPGAIHKKTGLGGYRRPLPPLLIGK